MDVSSGKRHTKTIIDRRYKLAREVREQWDKPHFYLAQYLDTIAHSLVVDTATSGQGLHKLEPYHAYMAATIDAYCKSVGHAAEPPILESLPRMLTLWFHFTALDIPASTTPIRSKRTAGAKAVEDIA
jgi:hypothetical protein